jgi:uncharacterized protein YhaN
MNKSVLDKLGKFESNVELAEVKVDLALSDDIRQAEDKLKNALLEFGNIKNDYLKAKQNFKNEADKAYNVAIKYNAMANDLGLKALDNPSFKMIDKYLASDLYKEVNK